MAGRNLNTGFDGMQAGGHQSDVDLYLEKEAVLRLFARLPRWQQQVFLAALSQWLCVQNLPTTPILLSAN